MVSLGTIERGVKNGVTTTLRLAKIMVPVYIVVIYLKHSGILEKMSKGLEPAMNLLGLPGEAAYPLVLGNFLNLYAGIGAITALSLTTKEITIIALMLLICHNIILETAVIKGCGVKVAPFVIVRFVFAVLIGIVANILL